MSATTSPDGDRGIPVEEFMRLNEELISLKEQLYNQKIAINKGNQREASLSADIANMQKRIASAEQELKDSRGRLDRAQDELRKEKEARAKEVAGLKKKADELSSQETRYKDEIKALRRRLEQAGVNPNTIPTSVPTFSEGLKSLFASKFSSPAPAPSTPAPPPPPPPPALTSTPAPKSSISTGDVLAAYASQVSSSEGTFGSLLLVEAEDSEEANINQFVVEELKLPAFHSFCEGDLARSACDEVKPEADNESKSDPAEQRISRLILGIKERDRALRAANAALTTSKAEIQKLKSDNERLLANIGSVQEKQLQLSQEIEMLHQKLKAANTQIQQQLEQIQALEEQKKEDTTTSTAASTSSASSTPHSSTSGDSASEGSTSSDGQVSAREAELQKQLDQLLSAIARKDSIVRDAQVENENLINRVREREAEAAAQRMRADRVEKELMGARQLLNEMNTLRAQAAQNSQLQAQIKQLTKQIENLNSQVAKSGVDASYVMDLEVTTRAKAIEVARILDDLDEAEDRRRRAEQRVAHLEAELAQRQKEIRERDARLVEEEEWRLRAEKILEECAEDAKATIAAERVEMEQQLAERSRALHVCETEKAKLQQAMQRLRAETAAEQTELLKQITSLEAQLSQTAADYKTALTRVAALEAENESMRSALQQSDSKNSLTGRRMEELIAQLREQLRREVAQREEAVIQLKLIRAGMLNPRDAVVNVSGGYSTSTALAAPASTGNEPGSSAPSGEDESGLHSPDATSAKDRTSRSSSYLLRDLDVGAKLLELSQANEALRTKVGFLEENMRLLLEDLEDKKRVVSTLMKELSRSASGGVGDHPQVVDRNGNPVHSQAIQRLQTMLEESLADNGRLKKDMACLGETVAGLMKDLREANDERTRLRAKLDELQGGGSGGAKRDGKDDKGDAQVNSGTVVTLSPSGSSQTSGPR